MQGGGCSGLSYNIRFDTQPRERDRIFQFDDVRVFVDPEVVHLPARHDSRLSGNSDAAGLRVRESKFDQVLRLRQFVLGMSVASGALAREDGSAPSGRLFQGGGQNVRPKFYMADAESKSSMIVPW